MLPTRILPLDYTSRNCKGCGKSSGSGGSGTPRLFCSSSCLFTWSRAGKTIESKCLACGGKFLKSGAKIEDSVVECIRTLLDEGWDLDALVNSSKSLKKVI